MTKTVPSGRPNRKPVGLRNKIEIVNKDPDRHYRLIDADPSRVAMFEEGGYRIEDLNSHVLGGLRVSDGKPVDNTLSVGGGKRQILVSIDKETYEFDQKTKEDRNKAAEADIKRKATADGLFGNISISQS